MRFELTEDQRELQRTVRAFVDHHDRLADDVWARLTEEMELTGLAIDAELGGTGASFVEVGIVLEELGRALVPVPYLTTVVAAHAISAGTLPEATAPLLARIAGGAPATVALAETGLAVNEHGASPTLSGRLEHVVDGSVAELLVIGIRTQAAADLFAVELSAPEVAVRARPTLDQTRGQATIELCDAPAVRVTEPAAGDRALARAADVLAVAHACEAVGAAAYCLESTIAYLTQRVQFGRPIGSFQALKHRCADLFVTLEAARSTAAYASWVVDGAPQELATVAPLAQLVGGEALTRIAGESIQLHGGIGFTWEHTAHLYLKRAKATELLSGGRASLRRSVGERAGII